MGRGRQGCGRAQLGMRAACLARHDSREASAAQQPTAASHTHPACWTPRAARRRRCRRRPAGSAGRRRCPPGAGRRAGTQAGACCRRAARVPACMGGELQRALPRASAGPAAAAAVAARQQWRGRQAAGGRGGGGREGAPTPAHLCAPRHRAVPNPDVQRLRGEGWGGWEARYFLYIEGRAAERESAGLAHAGHRQRGAPRPGLPPARPQAHHPHPGAHLAGGALHSTRTRKPWLHTRPSKQG